MQVDAHPSSAARLAKLRSYGLLDTPRARDFHEITDLVSVLCNVPIAAITLIDAERGWFLAEVGLGMRSTPVGESICAQAILDNDYVEIPDLTLDDRFRDFPYVAENPKLRFYAGAVLRSRDGLPLGTLCALDRKPREFTAEQRQTIEILARRVMAEFELRRQTRRILHLSDDLQVTREDRRCILGVISNDLRTPLNTVSLSAGLMARGGVQPAQRLAFTDRVRRAAQHMHRLVDDLLDVSSMREGKLSVQFKGLSVAELVAQAIDIVQPAAQAQGVSLSVTIVPTIGHAIWDGDRIIQAIENLLTNALKFTPRGRWVAVRVDAVERDIVLNIIDAGDGIPADRLARIFEPFVHGQDGDRRGDGMGMALVRGIVEIHGGTVSMRSTLGQGTDVRLCLPRDAVNTEEPHASA
ncbi:MAG: signal transduction histidine kinase [Bradymonadia bacterium]|jgi:signal transduction histidine kinase